MSAAAPTPEHSLEALFALARASNFYATIAGRPDGWHAYVYRPIGAQVHAGHRAVAVTLAAALGAALSSAGVDLDDAELFA